MTQTSDSLLLRSGTRVLLDELSRILRAIAGHPAVLLRSLPVPFDAAHHDVDLLVSEMGRSRILKAAIEAASAGRLHVAIRQFRSEKIRMSLWLPDAEHALHVDLWSAFTQLHAASRRWAIPADCLRPFIQQTIPAEASDTVSGTVSLMPELELCLLILHVAAKKGSVISDSDQFRFRQLRLRLGATSPVCSASSGSTGAREAAPAGFLAGASGHGCHRPGIQLPEADGAGPELRCREWCSRAAGRLSLSTAVPADDIRVAQIIVETILRGNSAGAGAGGEPGLARRSRTPLFARIRSTWHRATRTIAVVGSDGCGKTSVCRELVRQQPEQLKSLVARKLYRRSWSYQLAGGLCRMCCGWDRGEFDDRIPLAATLRAGVALTARQLTGLLANRIRQWSGRQAGQLVLDRAPASFLITHRKSAQPRLRPARWLDRLLPPVSSVLLTVPFGELRRRRLEMQSESSHEMYQALLVEQSLRQFPADLTVLAPLPSAGAAAMCLRKILRGNPGVPAVGLDHPAIDSTLTPDGIREAA